MNRIKQKLVHMALELRIFFAGFSQPRRYITINGRPRKIASRLEIKLFVDPDYITNRVIAACVIVFLLVGGIRMWLEYHPNEAQLILTVVQVVLVCGALALLCLLGYKMFTSYQQQNLKKFLKYSRMTTIIGSAVLLLLLAVIFQAIHNVTHIFPTDVLALLAIIVTIACGFVFWFCYKYKIKQVFSENKSDMEQKSK